MSKPNTVSQEEFETVDNAILEASIKDSLLQIINTCTVSRGIYTVPRLTLVEDLIKFMKENADEINTIK